VRAARRDRQDLSRRAPGAGGRQREHAVGEVVHFHVRRRFARDSDVSPVRAIPGATAFTRTFRSASSSARLRVKPATAALAAE